jgi:copper resistance protein B
MSKVLWKGGFMALALIVSAGRASCQVADAEVFFHAIADRLEYQVHDSGERFLWDVEGWVGGDINKFWVKAEGEKTNNDKIEQAELQGLFSRAITPFFDLQAGVRHDFRPLDMRTFGVFGIEGLAPYGFEMDAASFIGEDGDVSGRVEAEYDLLITQRLILQPRFEANLAVQDVKEYGVGNGLNDVELGLRLRYEIRREFAPYIGVSWERKVGEAAGFAREEHEQVESTSFVAGIRVWF